MKLLHERDGREGSTRAHDAWIETLPDAETLRETHPLLWSEGRLEETLGGSPTFDRLVAMGEDVERGAFYTLVPIRPRRRGERRFLRTFSPGASLRPGSLAHNPDTPPSTPFNSASDAFQLHPDVASYGTALRWTSATRTSPWSFTDDASARTSPGSRISC